MGSRRGRRYPTPALRSTAWGGSSSLGLAHVAEGKSQQKKERHHTLSRFYLEGFVDPSSPKGMLWQFDGETGAVTSVSPGDAAVRRYFYAFTKTDGTLDSTTFEDAFGLAETQTSPVIQKLMRRQHLDNTERSILSFFIALSMTRVPAYRKNFEAASAAAVTRVAQILAGQGYFDHIAPEVPEEKRKDLVRKLMAGEIVAEVTNPEMSLAVIKHATDFAAIIHGMHWMVFIASGSYRFVTGDAPVVYLAPTKGPADRRPVGLVHRNVELTFPLSMDIALLAHWTDAGDEFQRISDRTVKAINMRTIQNADRFVFGSEPSEGLSKLVVKHHGHGLRIRVG
jgi:uncharacterized protein DUF4238